MSPLQLGFRDIFQSSKQWRIWLYLGWQDIRLRYRRSQLGPLWITVSTCVMILSMGFLYGHLFKTNLEVYYPFLATGVVLWTFISSVVNESSDAFIEASGYIRQLTLPVGIYVLRLLSRNVIILGHNLIPIVCVLFYFHVHPSFFQCIELCLGLFLVLLSGFFYAGVIAIVGARFRDMKPIILSVVQVAFFVTPIMWQPEMLGGHYKIFYELNPLYQLLSLIRLPLTGHDLSWYTVLFGCGLSVVGFLLFGFLLSRAKPRIAFWV